MGITVKKKTLKTVKAKPKSASATTPDMLAGTGSPPELPAEAGAAPQENVVNPNAKPEGASPVVAVVFASISLILFLVLILLQWMEYNEYKKAEIWPLPAYAPVVPPGSGSGGAVAPDIDEGDVVDEEAADEAPGEEAAADEAPVEEEAPADDNLDM